MLHNGPVITITNQAHNTERGDCPMSQYEVICFWIIFPQVGQLAAIFSAPLNPTQDQPRDVIVGQPLVTADR